MINVNQLTSQLRMMPDQALQRMAMMYKNDPYIFPMVISEDMARKKMRQAAQAEMMQPQPKVADQAIMAMGQQPQPVAPAPGIAALQAPNLANMADGGIAGADEIATYADGGNVVMAPGSTPSYQRTAMSPGMLDFAQHSEPVIRMAAGGVPRYNGENDSFISRLPEGSGLRKFMDWYSAGKPSLSRPLLDIPEPPAYPTAEEAEMRRLMSPYKPRRTGDKKLDALEEAMIQARAKEKDAAATKPAADEKQATKKPSTAATPAPTAPAPTVPTAPAARTEIPTYTAPTPEATAAGIAALAKAPDEATQKAYKELMGMYEPERKELEARRGTRGGEALLRAGLAMLGGTSPYAAVNIGKGATEGLNAYQEAQRYDDQAARALRQAEISMRMAQRQEEAGNRRDAISLFGQAQQAQQAGVQSAQQAQQIRQTGEYQQGTLAYHNRMADIQAKKVQAYINALDAPQQERRRMMTEYGRIQTKVMDSLKTDPNFLTLPADKQAAYRQKRITEEIANNPFLSSLLFQATPGKGPVLDLTEGKRDEED